MTTTRIEQVPAGVDVTIVRGDRWSRRWRVLTKAEDGSVEIDGVRYNPVDISEWDLVGQIKAPGSSTRVDLDIDTESEGDDGYYTVLLTEENSALLHRVNGWGVKRIDAERTIIAGSFTALAERVVEEGS